MMSSGLSSTKPDIAAAVPVNEFRRLMTTGMSAPPMGSTIVTPKVSATARMTRRARILTSLPRAMTGDSPALSTRMSVPTSATMPSAAVVSDAARDRDGLAADEALELARGDERAAEGDAADEHAEDDEDGRRDVFLGRAHDVPVVEERHDGCGAAAHGVEERDELGHGRHGHAQGHQQAHGATDEEAAHDDDEALGREAALAEEEGQRT